MRKNTNLRNAALYTGYGAKDADLAILITTKQGKCLEKARINLSRTCSVAFPTKASRIIAGFTQAFTFHQSAAVSYLQNKYRS